MAGWVVFLYYFWKSGMLQRAAENASYGEIIGTIEVSLESNLQKVESNIQQVENNLQKVINDVENRALNMKSWNQDRESENEKQIDLEVGEEGKEEEKQLVDGIINLRIVCVLVLRLYSYIMYT